MKILGVITVLWVVGMFVGGIWIVATSLTADVPNYARACFGMLVCATAERALIRSEIDKVRRDIRRR